MKDTLYTIASIIFALVVSLCFAAMLGGCATGHAKPTDAALVAIGDRPLICKDEQQCAYYWQRAQFWLSMNSAFKIQIANDTQLATFTGVQPDMQVGYRITRERRGDGSSQIWVTAGCQNAFGCMVNPAEAIGSVKKYILEL